MIPEPELLFFKPEEEQKCPTPDLNASIPLYLCAFCVHYSYKDPSAIITRDDILQSLPHYRMESYNATHLCTHSFFELQRYIKLRDKETCSADVVRHVRRERDTYSRRLMYNFISKNRPSKSDAWVCAWKQWKDVYKESSETHFKTNNPLNLFIQQQSMNCFWNGFWGKIIRVSVVF